MRFMMYNIRYGTGAKTLSGPLGFFRGYFTNTEQHIATIGDFIHQYDPDVLGLVEVDLGSYRTGRKNQTQTIADKLGHFHAYRSKYGLSSRWNLVPVFNKLGNAFLTRDTIGAEKFHYFNRGMKKLVIELELENLTIFLVHLALGSRVRHHQLTELYTLVKQTEKPHIVAGDFNMLWGEQEIELFLAATGLSNPNRDSLPSFPSWAPKRHLDFILHSGDIAPINFEIPRVDLSDHLPLIFDFEIRS
jgi:endonuclease/exonuclease/phosphatase family metal-dependent hydrolase